MEGLEDGQPGESSGVMEKHKHMTKEEISKEVRLSLQRYLVDLIRAVVRFWLYTDSLTRTDNVACRCFDRNLIGCVDFSSYQRLPSLWLLVEASRVKPDS